MRVLLVDNFDSFTYNLVHYFEHLGAQVRVLRNQATLIEWNASTYTHLVISPGPGRPSQAGISSKLITEWAGKLPILGVCLGHQCIGEVFGSTVSRARQPMHGKKSTVNHTGQGLFRGLPQNFTVTRYHSLAIEAESLPDTLEVTATSDDQEIMGIKVKGMPIEGVQFHPESVTTEWGYELLGNFLNN